MNATMKPLRDNHPVASVLTGDASHSTDQPGGRAQGQVRQATISSNDKPENKATSKAQYTNISKAYLLSHLEIFEFQDVIKTKTKTIIFS